MQAIARARHVVRPAVFRIVPPLSSCEGGRDGDVLPATALSAGVGDRLIRSVHEMALMMQVPLGIQATNLPHGQAASDLLALVDRVDDRTVSADQASAPARGEALADQGITRFSKAPQEWRADRHGNS
jgi:hypothetical protein